MKLKQKRKGLVLEKANLEVFRLMGKKQHMKMTESDDDMEDRDLDDQNEDDYDDDNVVFDDKEDEDSDEKDGEIEGEDSDEDVSEDKNVENDKQMEELETEYKVLRNKEQDLWKSLKRHKDEDLQKGQAVKNQRALWDKALEFRFLLQKPFLNSNRLPQEPLRSLFCDTDSDVNEAYSDLIVSSKKTLDSILELQQALARNNPSITQFEASQEIEASGDSNGDIDAEWLNISQMQSRMASFRNTSIDKWQRKTQVTTGAAAIKDKLHAFNQSVSEQVAAYMRDPSRMIKGMQQNSSAVAVFGNVPNSTENMKPQESYANVDPELLDDSEFYGQLLKEFFEAIDPSSSETAFYALKRLQSKKRKIVDRRASKSRKIRYHAHEKITNFMAPRPLKLPPMAPKLFGNLFGLKKQMPAS